MNKIVVEQNEIHLQDEELMLSTFPNKLTLKISGNVYCGIEEFNNKELYISLQENSHLQMEFLVKVVNTKNKITIYNEENSKLDLHYACTYKNENELIINSNVSTSNNNNTILVRAVEEDGTLNIVATGIIEENTKNNTYLEDIKAITNKKNSIKIRPDLIVKTNSVLASHNATISPVEDSELFYLESKGLEKMQATSLIKEGFLKGIIEKEEIKN